MSKDKLYKLYSIKNYGKATKKFINEDYEEYKLNALLERLKNDEGYHMRIHSDESYIFFGDCDWFRGSFKEFANLLINFLSNHYKIKIKENEISYTANESNNDEKGS